MILPSSVLTICVTEDGQRKCRIWLPLFLVWPIVIVSMVVLAPIALVVAAVCRRWSRVILAGPELIAACWSLRGLRVRVEDGGDQVLINVR